MNYWRLSVDYFEKWLQVTVSWVLSPGTPAGNHSENPRKIPLWYWWEREEQSLWNMSRSLSIRKDHSEKMTLPESFLNWGRAFLLFLPSYPPLVLLSYLRGQEMLYYQKNIFEGYSPDTQTHEKTNLVTRFQNTSSTLHLMTIQIGAQ